MSLDKKNDLKIAEWIERYWNGNLTGEDLSKFEKQYKQDKIFAAKVDFHKDLRDILFNDSFLEFMDIIEEAQRLSKKQKPD